MNKDGHPAPAARAGRRRRATTFAAAAAGLAMLAGQQALAQEAYDAAWCEILAHVGHDAAELRMEGLSQQQTAEELAAMISEAAGGAPGAMQERAEAAKLLGWAATHVLRFVYSVPIEPEDSAFPFYMGAFIYSRCAAGEI